MVEQDRASELAGMAARRVELRKARLRQDIALAILQETGAVSEADIDTRFGDQWTDPSEQTLKEEMAQKCLAAVVHAKAQVAVAEHAAEEAQRKVGKQEEQLAAARSDAEGAVDAIEDAQQALSEAESMLQAANAWAGIEATPVPPSEEVAAHAEVAEAKAEGSN
jgi:hypothetical protein